jgi:biotin synthase
MATLFPTRTYEDRLETLENVREAKISVCSGGIIGMGEKEEDRIGMLQVCTALKEHPESVPVNALVPVEGTPLEDQPKVSVWGDGEDDCYCPHYYAKDDDKAICRKSSYEFGRGPSVFGWRQQYFAGDKLLTTLTLGWSKTRKCFKIGAKTPPCI